jgi:hypothetical protein
MSFGVGRVNGFLWSEENTRLGIGWKYLILCVFGRNLGSGPKQGLILLPLVMYFFSQETRVSGGIAVLPWSRLL